MRFIFQGRVAPFCWHKSAVQIWKKAFIEYRDGRAEAVDLVQLEAEGAPARAYLLRVCATADISTPALA